MLARLSRTRGVKVCTRNFTSSAFTSTTISTKVLDAQYAVRGKIVIRADEIKQELKNNKHGKNFQKVIMCNIGNPQELGQLPFTFFRQVLAGCICPSLITNEQQSPFTNDVIDRCKRILAETNSNNIGAYTHSQGLQIIRESVCHFIQARDGGECPDPKHIFLTDGASPGIKHVLQALINDKKDGILTPVPQYPLYSASIALLGGSKIDYHLNEQNGWSFEIENAEHAISVAKNEHGIKPRAIVIINPGNPTGNVLSEENIQQVIEFAAKENLIIIGDEVYQENVYNSEKKFYSFSSVLQSMIKRNDEYKKVGIFSFHSISKGVIGECGLRGGYMHFSNIHDSGYEQLYKLASVGLCSNIVGQIAVDLMCKPPELSSVSYDLYKYEYQQLFASLQRRAKVISVELNKIPGIDCQYVDGALYAFPNICIPEGAIKESELKGFECADVFYCMELLENAGICCVPGSGFGQSEGSYHLRTTILPPEDEIEDVVQKIASFHLEFCKKFGSP